MGSRRRWSAYLPEAPALWEPCVDVYRTKDGWLLKFDLAGVQPEDVTVSVRGRRIAVSGLRRDSNLEEGCSYYSMEISYNRFERAIEMPANLENARVTLEVRNGLLLVRVITEGKENA